MTTVTERVAAGAAFLDQADPEWWRADVERAIDLDRLAMENTAKCVLGQRCPFEMSSGDSRRFKRFAKLLSHLRNDDSIREWAQALGFWLPDYPERGAGEHWYSLTAEWRRVIEARRAS